MKVKRVYKIRHIPTGKFSPGGSHCVTVTTGRTFVVNDSIFTKNGKTWTSPGHVTNHLKMYTNEPDQIYLDETEVVVYTIQEEKSIPSNWIFNGYFAWWPKIVKWGRARAVMNLKNYNKKIAYLSKVFIENYEEKEGEEKWS